MERFPTHLPARLLPVDDAEEQEAIEVLTSDVCAGGDALNKVAKKRKDFLD